MKHKKQLKKLELNKQTIATVSGKELKRVRGGAWTFNGDCSGGCSNGEICGNSGGLLCDVWETFTICMINDEMDADE